MARHVIFRTDRIGDVVLTLPMAEALKREDPAAHVTFCVQEYTRGLVSLCPFVDDILSIAGRDLPRDRAEWVRMLGDRAFDAAYFAYPRPRLAHAARKAHIPVRVGTAYRWYSPLFTHRVQEHRQPSVLHERDYNLNLLRAAGIPVTDDLLPRIDIPPAAREQARRIAADAGIPGDAVYGVLHPGSGGSARDWPPGRFAELAQLLLDAYPALHMLVTGTDTERPLMEQVRNGTGGLATVRLHLLPTAVPLELLAGILAEARFTAANSTGPLHIAAAAGTPVLGLYPFGRVTHPRRWGPLGERVAVLTPEPANDCRDCAAGSCARHDDMRRIPAAAAMDALERLHPLDIPS